MFIYALLIQMKFFRYIIPIILIGAASCTRPEKEPVDYVDPFIGTGGKVDEGHGNTFPGAAWPFGMIQLSPDNGGQGPEYCSGYHYPDSFIVGFSHTHLSGTGVGDLADISVMPTTKEIKKEYFIQDSAFVEKYCRKKGLNPNGFLNKDGLPDAFTGNFLLKYRSGFSHNLEKATPGYYFVNLTDDNIDVELTVSEFVGIHRYTFHKKTEWQHIILNLGFNINRDKPTGGYIHEIAPDMVAGYRFSTGWADEQRVFFAMKFSKPIRKIRFFNADSITGEKSACGAHLAGVFSFKGNSNNRLLVKVSISSANETGALANLKTAASYGWNFDAMRKAARKKWNEVLKKTQILSNNEAQKTTFYTSLYHCYLAPYRFSDVNGTYKNYLNQVDTARGYIQYSVFSLWDIFRAEAPLLVLMHPGLYENMIRSMLAMCGQTGSLPYWEIAGNEGGSMTGYHAVVLIADAILKGIGNFDRELAYHAMIDASNTNREGLEYYRKYHYVPTDKEKSGTVSKTIEYAFDDWCIAQVAKKLGKTEDYKKYMARSGYWKNIFDSRYRLMRGKNSNGSWYKPFIPRFAQYGNPLCVEGNTWQYSFFVPQDIKGLIKMMGGKKGFEIMLDSLFTQTSKLLGEDTEDVTGMIGQYSQGNEPSHHAAYLYDFIGKDYKTQYYVNKIIDSLYFNSPRGLCGNEDCGQMSAWYVFSATGFYPVNPVSGKYWFGSPQFKQVNLHLPDGNIFTIEARHVSDKNIYIKSKKLNGKSLDRSYVTYDEIEKGGILHFDMTDMIPSDEKQIFLYQNNREKQTNK